jgi:hypothetical protein
MSIKNIGEVKEIKFELISMSREIDHLCNMLGKHNKSKNKHNTSVTKITKSTDQQRPNTNR